MRCTPHTLLHRMHTLRCPPLVLAILCAALAACSKSESPTANSDQTSNPTAPVVTTFDVYTPGNTFSPFSLRVTRGSTVRFNIYGENHNVIFGRSTSGAPTDINVVKDVVVSRQFSAAGSFSYSCTVHPGMTGEIVVM